MSTRIVTVAGGLLAGGLLAVTAATPALAVCDAYSEGCVEPPAVRGEVLTRTPAGPQVLSRPVVPADTARSGSGPAALPFTGGELVLVSALGAAAVAGGVGLVVAGRRRNA